MKNIQVQEMALGFDYFYLRWSVETIITKEIMLGKTTYETAYVRRQNNLAAFIYIEVSQAQLFQEMNGSACSTSWPRLWFVKWCLFCCVQQFSTLCQERTTFCPIEPVTQSEEGSFTCRRSSPTFYSLSVYLCAQRRVTSLRRFFSSIRRSRVGSRYSNEELCLP